MKFAPTYEEHIHRYAFAMKYAHKREVLDAGCKEGFGAQVLSWVSNSIHLVDKELLYIRRAKHNNGYVCPHTFEICDFDKTFPKGQWDTITCFEVIEHVEDPDFFVKNMAKALRPGGVLVFSVPHMVENHEHKTLFDEEKIKKLISKYLTIEEFYTQDEKYLRDEELYRGLKCYVGVARKNGDSI